MEPLGLQSFADSQPCTCGHVLGDHLRYVGRHPGGCIFHVSDGSGCRCERFIADCTSGAVVDVRTDADRWGFRGAAAAAKGFADAVADAESNKQ